MNNEEKQKNYELAEKLISEQNFAAAVIAGAVATVLAAAAYGIIVATWNFSYGFAAAGVGIVIGLPMGFLGRGISTKFAVLATLYVVAGCVLGNLVRVVMELTTTSPMSVLRSHSLSVLVERALANIFSIHLVYWFVAVACAVFFARRALSRSERLAIGMLELRG
jgi:dipeptide/tripeptide permease